jgi:hypothetical protein
MAMKMWGNWTIKVDEAESVNDPLVDWAIFKSGFRLEKWRIQAKDVSQR